MAFVAAGPSATHCLVGAVDGRLFTWGRNEKGQLGHGDLRQRNVPSVVGGLLAGKKAIAAAGGESHSLVAVENGDAYAFGSNTQGQCGLGSIRITSAAAASATAPAGEDLQLSPVKSAAVAGVTSVAAGADFSAWLNAATGALYTDGCPQYGVLGHGTDNEYNARDSSVKLVYAPQPTPRMVQALAAVKVRAVACGTQHMLGEFFFFFFLFDLGSLLERTRRLLFSCLSRAQQPDTREKKTTKNRSKKPQKTPPPPQRSTTRAAPTRGATAATAASAISSRRTSTLPGRSPG